VAVSSQETSQETTLGSKHAEPGRFQRKQWVQGALIVALTACLLIAGVFGVRLALDRWSEPSSLDQIERLMNRQSWPKAEEQLRRYLARHSNEAPAQMLLGRVLAARKAYADCAVALEGISEVAPERALALLRAGQAWQEGKYRRAAERAWKTCLELSSGDVDLPAVQQDCRRGLCMAYALERRRDDLWDMTGQMMAHTPQRQWHEPFAMRARYEFEMVDPQVALGLLGPALINDPDDLLTRRAIGLYHLEAGNTEKARAQLIRCMQESPDNLLMWEAWLQCLSKTGAGEFELERAVNDLPSSADGSAECWKARQILAERQDNLQLAQQAAEQTVRLEPSEPEHHHQLGLILMRLGKKEDGQSELARSQELQQTRQELRQLFDDYRHDYDRMEPGSRTELVYHFGQVYEKLGREEEAAAWYRVALSENPSHQLSMAALERLRVATGSDANSPPAQK
jgi:tetratricopeptide (TPR) repeat protein